MERNLLMLIFAVATISYTVTCTRIFRGLRDWVIQQTYNHDRGEKGYVGEWISCPYCFSHWVSAALVVLCRVYAIYSGSEFIDIVVSTFALVMPANVLIQTFRVLGTIANHKEPKNERDKDLGFESVGVGSRNSRSMV